MVHVIATNATSLMMSDRGQQNSLRQRAGCTPVVPLGHNAMETFAKLQQAYGDSVLSRAQATPISEFHQCYEEWKKRLQRCVASEGSYFEGDYVELDYEVKGTGHAEKQATICTVHIGFFRWKLWLLQGIHQWIEGTRIDEAHFWLNGYVNKQNCRIWSEANPQVSVETPLHPEKLTVWCASRAGGIQKR
ncbi:putative transposable element [Trichonephila clavipes]|nr:putative transposable element [Trichonephila clavipes]